MASIEELQRQRRWKNSVIPVNYYTVEAYGLRGRAADIAAYLEKELGILRSELDKIDRILERKVSKEHRDTERRARAVAINRKHTAVVVELRAQAAASLGKTRQRGSVVRRRLPTNHPCPYCGGSLGEDYHTDHIYPVSKGGQSSLRNMVNVCRTCNARKGTMTLATFIRDYGLNQQEIERRLLALGKDF